MQVLYGKLVLIAFRMPGCFISMMEVPCKSEPGRPEWPVDGSLAGLSASDDAVFRLYGGRQLRWTTLTRRNGSLVAPFQRQ